MKELGRILRNKREEMGLSLDEVQTKTKIRKRYLIALEDGDWGLLPGDVYARGFVRSYAEALELDGKHLLDKYLSPDVTDTPSANGVEPSPSPVSKPQLEPKMESPAPPPPRPRPTMPAAPRKPQKARPPVASRQKTKSRNYVAETAAVVGILAVIGAAWWFISSPAKSPGNNNHVATGQTGDLNATTDSNATGNATANTTANGTSSVEGNTTNATSPATPPSVQVVSQTFNGNEQNYIVSASGPLQVQLSTTTDPCWIQAIVDGANVDPNDTVAAGDKRTWTVNQTVRIRIGNVPAVAISVNGQALTLPNVSSAIWVTISKSKAQ